MAILKHLASKNADYGDAVRYLEFKHDSLTGRPLIENGHLIMREDFLIDGIECSPFTFGMECDDLNRKYHKNQEYKDIKSHHYIISFDPKDVTECGLTMEKAQEVGMDFTKNFFPGHQAVVCTHADGENQSGNIHVHIVINSLRKLDVEPKAFMERKCDSKAGYKHHLTNNYLEYMKRQLMSICRSLGLHQVDLLSPAKDRVTDKEQWIKARGQKRLDAINHKRSQNGESPEKTEFLTIKEELRRAVRDAARTARDETEFSKILKQKYGITLKVSRGSYGYIHPDRTKPIRGRMLGTEYTEDHLKSVFSRNLITAFQEEYKKPDVVLQVSSEITEKIEESDPQLIRPSRRKRITAIKESAEAVAYLQEQGYTSVDELKSELKGVQMKETSLSREIRAADKGITDLNAQLHNTGKYYARKQVYKEFLHSKDKGKFRAAHSTAIREFEEARRWLHNSVDDGTLPSFNYMESEEGKFPGLRTVRTIRDKEIEKRNQLREQHKAVKQKKNQLTSLLQKVQTLLDTPPAIDETLSTRKKNQQSL